jgi:2-C-methyl-D-erythritol 4-phosphate cytidylyltransferase
VRQLILVVAEEDLAWVSEELKRQQESQRVQVVTGGMERANSVENALKYVDSQHHYVAIHDAARPCISVALIDRVLSQARISGAAIPVVTIHSTVKQSSDGRFVHRTLDRSQLFLAQTPQVFRRDWIVEAYSKQVCQVTDEAQLLEQLGYPVAMVEGSATNLKLTVPEDLLLAELFVRQFHQ